MTEKKNEGRIKFRTILYYNSLFWGVWLIFYAFVFLRNIKQPFLISLFNSFTITSPLFLLSLLLWPFIRKLQYSQISLRVTAIIHFVSANVYSILWLSIYYGILLLIFGDHLYDLFNVSETIGWQYPSGITFYLMVSGGYYSLTYYREIKSREIKETRLELLLKETQFNALKSQLNPHFLFNSLNSINALITSEPQKAREMLIKLSDLLRLSISKQKQSFISLDTELEFAHAYLDIEKIRLTGRLDYQEKIDESLVNIVIPSMILQPLLENAIKHGVAPLRQKGFIDLSISGSGSKIEIVVRNSTPKVSTEAKQNANTGLGLKNIKKRLQSIYGQDMKFSYGHSDAQQYHVKIELPISKKA